MYVLIRQVRGIKILHGVSINVPEDFAIVTEEGDDAAVLQDDLPVLADPDPVHEGPVHREVGQHGALVPHLLLDGEVLSGDPDEVFILEVIAELVKHVLVDEEVAGGGVPADSEGGVETEHPDWLLGGHQPAPSVGVSRGGHLPVLHHLVTCLLYTILPYND